MLFSPDWAALEAKACTQSELENACQRYLVKRSKL